MAGNPLHGLIEQLDSSVRTAWRCHHASTKDEKQETLKAWRALMDPFWGIHRIPAQAIRGLADPALSWCSKRGLNSPDHIATVERAVELIVALAMITAPCVMPSVYANKEEAQKTWDRQGELLMAALASQDSLRRLAALAGDEWKGEVRLPWEKDSEPTGSVTQTPAVPSAPPKKETSDTRPDSPMPPDSHVEAAMRDVPQTIADMENTREYYAPVPAPGQQIVLHHALVKMLGNNHRHGKAAAAWAIHRLVEKRMLIAKLGMTDTPSFQGRDGVWHGGDRYEVHDLKYRLIESAPSLWTWWNAMAAAPKEPTPAAQQAGDDSSDYGIPRIRSLMDRLTASAERFMRTTVRLLFVPGPDTLPDLISKVRPDRPSQIDVPIPPLDGLEVHDFLGTAVVYKEGGQANVFILLVRGGDDGAAAASAFCDLASESGRLYQTMPAHTMPVHGTTSPRNLWCSVLYGWLQGTAWVHQSDGYEIIPLAFAASTELWRRLLYGTTPDGRVQPGAISPGPHDIPSEDLPVYQAEDQAWWGPLPPTKDAASVELCSLADGVDVVLITATAVELEAMLRRLEPRPGSEMIIKGVAEQETYYLGKFGAFTAVVTKCRMGSLDSGGAILATQHAQRVWRPRAIIMAGIAFGKDPTTQMIADVLVATQIISYEPQRIGEKQTVNRGPITPTNTTLLNRFDNALGWTFSRPDGTKSKVQLGPLLSGEKLIDDSVLKDSLFERYPHAIGGDMEGVGLAAAAVRHGVPWIVVKAICDWADGRKHAKHHALAAAAAVSLVHQVLSQTDVLHGLNKRSQ